MYLWQVAAMRLFSKVKPGTAFLVDTENHAAADLEHTEARVAKAAQDDEKYEQQVSIWAEDCRMYSVAANCHTSAEQDALLR